MASTSLIDRLRRYWRVDDGQPELLVAQYKAFAVKMPMMYVILVVNSWALAYTHLGSAPYWLSVYYPGVMTLLCGARFCFWWRGRKIEPDAAMAARALRRTNMLTAPIALSFSIWAVMLFPYGDAYARAHVAFYMGITVISCIFCLMYLRSAALTAALIVNGIFTLFFISTDIPVFSAAALNVVLVTLVMLVVVNSHYREFTGLIAAQLDTAILGRENSRLANLDPLTQLPNRRQFFGLLDSICARASSGGERFAVAILDLDGFKAVNDLYGHAYGDALLAEVGRRLMLMCNDQHLHLARLGGDEFALIIDRGLADQELLGIGKRVCETLRQPFVVQKATVQIAASIGVATFPDMASDAATLYEHADYALYQGKRAYRGTVTLFSDEDKAQIQYDANIEQALRQANFSEELTVFFQPIVQLHDRRPIAFEALARWNSPMIGMVSPADFIPAAERMGMINQLSVILLEKSLQAAARWPQALRLSFNLSANDINTSDGLAEIIRVISDSGVAPGRIDLEITETAVLHDLDKTREMIMLLRQRGCGVTLDDFGTGYASLSHLHALPLSRIKIDKSFVADLEHNPVSHKIVKSLLTLSLDMQLACVVEGLESEQHLAILSELGATLGQGYLFARPMPEAQIAAWLAAAPASGAIGAD